MFKVLDLRYTITSRTHIAQTVIPALYNKTTGQIDMELSEKPYLVLSTDSTGRLELQSYLIIMAHYSSWEIKSPGTL